MNNNFKHVIEAALKGDKRGFEELYNMTKRNAYFVAFSITKNEQDALDIMQDSYLKAFNHLGTVNPPEMFDNWFNKIVANESKNYIKKKKPMLFADIEGELPAELVNAEVQDSNYIPHKAADNAETNQLIMDIINDLEEDKRLVVLMYYYQEMKVAEIADALEIPVTTVKYKLLAARKDIKREVEKLEKKGTKLYSVVPFAAIPAVLSYFAAGSQTPAYASVISEAALSTGAAVNAVTNAAAKTAANTTAKAAANTAANVAANAAAKTGFWKFISTTVGKLVTGAVTLVVVGAVIAAMIGINASNNSKNKKAAETSTVDQPSATSSLLEGKEQEEDTTSSDNTSNEEEKYFTEKEFDTNSVDDLGFIAPSVHDESDGECTFIWSHGETDMMNWLNERYSYLDDGEHYTEGHVSNKSGDWTNMRICSIKNKSKEETADYYEATITTKSYTGTSVSEMQFAYYSMNQDKVIAEAAEFLNYMGFGEYADTILHSESYEIEIPVENGMGDYSIVHMYSFNKYNGFYRMYVSVTYSDIDYFNLTNYPENFEVWSDDNELKDWIVNSTIDTSSPENFLIGMAEYIKGNINNTITYQTQVPYMTNYYEYDINYETGEKNNIDAYYRLELSDQGNKDSFNSYVMAERITLSMSDSSIYVSVDDSPVYDHELSGPTSLSDAETDRLMEIHLNVLKQIQKDITFTKSNVLDNYRNQVLHEDTEKARDEDENFRYLITTDLMEICMYISRK